MHGGTPAGRSPTPGTALGEPRRSWRFGRGQGHKLALRRRSIEWWSIKHEQYYAWHRSHTFQLGVLPPDQVNSELISPHIRRMVTGAYPEPRLICRAGGAMSIHTLKNDS